MDTKKVAVVSALFVVIAIFAVSLAIFYNAPNKQEPIKNVENNILQKEEKNVPEKKIEKFEESGEDAEPISQLEARKIESETWDDAPKNIAVPEKGEELSETQEDIAVPDLVTSAAPGSSASLRKFVIKGENNKFNPSTVIVKKGDSVHIDLIAVDKDYDIVFPDYGMKQTAKKGEEKIVAFQAVIEGKFTFYCEVCGGLDSEAKGYVIVAP